MEKIHHTWSFGSDATVLDDYTLTTTTSPAWVPEETRASPPAAAASAAAGRPPTPSFQFQEDEGVFHTGQGEDWELPELFDSGRLTPDQVLFDDVDVDRLSMGFGPTSKPPMSDSDSDAMGEEFPFDMSDLERETDMVIVDLDRRDDWDDRPCLLYTSPSPRD